MLLHFLFSESSFLYDAVDCPKKGCSCRYFPKSAVFVCAYVIALQGSNGVTFSFLNIQLRPGEKMVSGEKKRTIIIHENKLQTGMYYVVYTQ